MSETIFNVNGVEYDVIKRGMDQARQVAAATRWMSKYGTPAFRSLSENGAEAMGGVELAISILGSLDADALVDLFQLTFGCSRKVAEQEFDLLLVIDGLTALYNESPVIRKIADRFFSVQSYESTEEDSSTQSDLPMDTQTIK